MRAFGADDGTPTRTPTAWMISPAPLRPPKNTPLAWMITLPIPVPRSRSPFTSRRGSVQPSATGSFLPSTEGLRILYVPSGVVRLEFEPVGGYCARMIPSGSSHIRRQVDVSRACRGSAASPNAPNSPPRKGKGWTETNRRRAAQQGATGRHRGPNAAAAPRFWFLSGHFFPRVAWSHKVTSYSELFRCAQQVRTPVSE